MFSDTARNTFTQAYKAHPNPPSFEQETEWQKHQYQSTSTDTRATWEWCNAMIRRHAQLSIIASILGLINCAENACTATVDDPRRLLMVR